MKYTVRIEEVLVKEIEVEAATQYEARCKVEDMILMVMVKKKLFMQDMMNWGPDIQDT